MSHYVLLVLEEIERLTDEMDVTGVHRDALPESIRKFNDALAVCKDTDPEHGVWRLLTPLDPGAHSASDLTLACRTLKEVVRERIKLTQTPPMWLVSEETMLDGTYEGTIVITEKCTFTLNGSATGNVFIHKHAVFICNGYLKGDIEKDSTGSLIINGKVSGAISTTQFDRHVPLVANE